MKLSETKLVKYELQVWVGKNHYPKIELQLPLITREVMKKMSDDTLPLHDLHDDPIGKREMYGPTKELMQAVEKLTRINIDRIIYMGVNTQTLKQQALIGEMDGRFVDGSEAIVHFELYHLLA